MAAACLLQALACTMLLLGAVAPLTCTAAVPSKTLQERCEIYAGGDRGSFDYAYCVWTLQRADSRSATADELGLAVIAARMARATARATADKIAALLRANETVPAPAARCDDCLAACAREYAAVVRRLGHAASAAARAGGSGRKNNLERAQTLLAEATGAPARCVAAFAAAGRRQDSPLDGRDFGLDDQIALAAAILPPPRPSSPPDVA